MIGLVIAVTLVGLVVIVALNARRRSATVAAPPADTPAGVPLEARREARETVLRKLADKELTREQAEAQLAELDNPVPETLPTPQAQRGVGGRGCGCLAASLLGLLILILCGACYAYFSVRRVRLLQDELCREAMAAHRGAAERHQRGLPSGRLKVTMQAQHRDASDSVVELDATRVLMQETVQDGGVE